jgi:hypothetical protein
MQSSNEMRMALKKAQLCQSIRSSHWYRQTSSSALHTTDSQETRARVEMMAAPAANTPPIASVHRSKRTEANIMGKISEALVGTKITPTSVGILLATSILPLKRRTEVGAEMA